MKHLKKVLLFRVGFYEKVSRQDKNFLRRSWRGSRLRKGGYPNLKKMATQGAAIQSRAKNENPLR